ncbi:MAG: hypothetical protein JSR45_02880 [Proteobacteria bacterium]|nr:hypothetical protein [Pseudomonadota bacterium]
MAEPKSLTYPKILREDWPVRIIAGLGLAVVVIAAVVNVGVVSQLLSGRASPWQLLTIPVVVWIAWFAIKTFCDTALTSVTLTDDAFEARGPLVHRRLHRSQIAGYRIIERSRLPSRLRLEMADASEKPLEVNLFDATAIGSWFQYAPTLDQQEAVKARQAMLDDPAYGATADERARALRIWSKAGGGASLLGFAVALWIGFLPEPRALVAAVATLLPLVGFVLLALAGRRFSAFSLASDARTPLMGLFLGGAALGIRDVAFEQNLLSNEPVLAPALAIGLAGLGALWFLDRSVFGRNGGWWLAGGLIAAWGAGVLVEADVQLDRAPARIYPTQVIDRHVYNGRSTHWYVIVAPWGPQRDETRIEDAKLYNKVTVGQQVCVALHSGALGMAWREVTPCQDADTAKA